MNTDMSPHRTCGTCKHKGENLVVRGEDLQDKPTRFFLCELIKHNDSAGAGMHGSFFSEDRSHEESQGKGAFVVDGSGYHAALCVEEDFGCNKWELRPGLIGMSA